MLKILNIAISLLSSLYRNWANFLTVLGNIKIFSTPCFLIYDPNEFDYKIRGEAIREIEKQLKPGDIILRKYDHYLDGYLIPGKYSHASIYIGNSKLIHAVAEGVKEIDLIDFCQCDNICILRPLEDPTYAITNAILYKGKPYDFYFNAKDSKEFYCHELVAKCYNKIRFKRYYPKFLGIKLKFLAKRYLADSFLENKHFNKIIEL